MGNEATGFRARIQKFGGVLSGMVMPNIGAFITWGLITAMFLKTGWFPNEKDCRTDRSDVKVSASYFDRLYGRKELLRRPRRCHWCGSYHGSYRRILIFRCLWEP